jgi:CheY-like chemotaxis protein
MQEPALDEGQGENMRVVPPRPLGLPHVNDLHPSVSLDAIGRALSRIYEDLITEGVPDHLAAFVERLEATRAGASPAPRPVALVVEDELLVRQLAATVLGELGLEIVEAETGEEAMTFMEERGGDVALVFADVRLPGSLDGIDLADRIGLRWPHARVVVTSGASGDRVRSLPGNVTFLPKPWRSLDVVAEARRAVPEVAAAPIE